MKLTCNNLRYPIESIIEKITNENLIIKKQIENNELNETTENKKAYEFLRSINFHNSIFGINADYEKMNEVIEGLCYYTGMNFTLENRCMIKYFLYENVKPENLLSVYFEIEKKNNESKRIISIMTKDKYNNNKKRSIPYHIPQAQDLIDGKNVKGQDLYNALKVLNWCRYKKEEVEEFILCLKSQKAKSGNRYNEATNIIKKYWNIWTDKNNT
jgi:hypothetical protein